MFARIAVVVPIEEEFCALRSLVPDLTRIECDSPWELYSASDERVIFVISDCGPVNAAAATERLIAKFSPDVVLHAGCAGACDLELLPGDVVVGRSYAITAPAHVRQARIDRGLHPSLIRMRRDGKRHYLDFLEADSEMVSLGAEATVSALRGLPEWSGIGWPPGIRQNGERSSIIRLGRIGSADSWTTDPGELARLNSLYGIDCEDMESAYVAQVCALHQIRCLTIRVISDNETVAPLQAADVKPLLAEAGMRSAGILHSLITNLLSRQSTGSSRAIR